MGKLSQKRIRDLKKPGRYGDGDGLFLHIRDGGSRQWVLRTTIQGKRKDIGLGSASLVSLAEARETAHAHRRLAKQGIDPVLLRHRARGVPTYKEAAENVWDQNKPTWKNPKHADQWINTQKTYVFPKIGDKKIDQITSAQVLEVLAPIWLSKAETARRVKQRMKMVFDWAKAAGHRHGDNPLEGVDKVLPKQNRTQQHHAAMPSLGRLPAQNEMCISKRSASLIVLALAAGGAPCHSGMEPKISG